MKKLSYQVFFIGTTIFLIACTAKKAVITNTPKVENSALLTLAQQRWPAITQHDLDSGQTIFKTKCTQCHGIKPIASLNEAQWQESINDMAPKARLTTEQKEILTKYIFASREMIGK